MSQEKPGSRHTILVVTPGDELLHAISTAVSASDRFGLFGAADADDALRLASQMAFDLCVFAGAELAPQTIVAAVDRLRGGAFSQALPVIVLGDDNCLASIAVALPHGPQTVVINGPVPAACWDALLTFGSSLGALHRGIAALHLGADNRSSTPDLAEPHNRTVDQAPRLNSAAGNDHRTRTSTTTPSAVQGASSRRGQSLSPWDDLSSGPETWGKAGGLSTAVSGRSPAALRDKVVLIVDCDRSPRRLIRNAVFATGAMAHTVSTSDEGLAILRVKPCDLLFVDFHNAWMIPEAIQLVPSLRVIINVSTPVFDEMALRQLPIRRGNVIFTNYLTRMTCHDPLAIREVATTTGKILSKDIFGLEKYLGWGTDVHQQRLTSSDQRGAVIENLNSYLLECGLRNHNARQLCLVADELIANAIWDAPADGTGQAKYANLPRENPLHLLPNETVEVRYGNDANCFGISVRDPFGRLEYSKIISYLKHCFGERNQVRKGPGGAGIGLFMAYNNLSSLVVNVAPHTVTEVIGLFKLHHTNPSQKCAHSFCFFQAPNDSGLQSDAEGPISAEGLYAIE